MSDNRTIVLGEFHRCVIGDFKRCRGEAIAAHVGCHNEMSLATNNKNQVNCKARDADVPFPTVAFRSDLKEPSVKLSPTSFDS